MQAEVRQTLNRYAVSVIVATFVTAALILIMQLAIDSDDVAVAESRHVFLDPVTPVIKEPPPEPRDRIPPRPKPPLPPPDVTVPDFGPVPTGFGGPVVSLPPPGRDLRVTSGYGDGDMLPIMTVPPEYPDRLAASGTEGWVLVEFSVDELGRVVAPRVLESYPSRGFDRAALKAVQRYKYKPRVVNGATVPVHGVRQRIVFSLAEA